MKKLRLRRLLEVQHLGDRKPSVALRHMQGLAPGNDNLIRLRFLDILPEKVRVVMATLGDVRVETMAEVADKTMELLSDQTGLSGVNAVSDDSSSSDLKHVLCAITKRLERLESRSSRPNINRDARRRPVSERSR